MEKENSTYYKIKGRGKEKIDDEERYTQPRTPMLINQKVDQFQLQISRYR